MPGPTGPLRVGRVFRTRPGAPAHRWDNQLRFMRVLLLACAVLVAVLTPLDAAVRPPRLQYQTTTLPNGLRVILSEDHSVPIAHVSVWYHVGSKNERPGRTGF